MEKNTNDTLILQLKQQISEKKSKLQKLNRFTPITNMSLELFGERHNLNVLGINVLLLLKATLTSIQQHSELPLIVSGFQISDWISDLQLKIRLLNKDAEQKKLDELEKQLRKLLSEDKKVELELDSIEGLLG